MKYEEIKKGESYNVNGVEEKVIAKVDEHKTVVTTRDWGGVTIWRGDELESFKPIKEQLPEEGLLVNKDGAIAYRTGEASGYGFSSNKIYKNLYGGLNSWTFNSYPENWRKATKQEEEKFVEMLKKECEARGLFEDTKIECHADGTDTNLNINCYEPTAYTTDIFNNNGQIFRKGKFATPKKEEDTLTQVSKAVQEIGNFTVEQTESGVIILTPIKK